MVVAGASCHLQRLAPMLSVFARARDVVSSESSKRLVAAPSTRKVSNVGSISEALLQRA